MIELCNVCKSFGNLQVLKGINLRVETGSVAAIIGPSGSGKTTCLRAINFLEPADAGSMLLDDIHIDFENISKSQVHRVRKHTAMVFQSYNLFRNKTALENIMLGLTVVHKKDRRQALAEAEYYLGKVGMLDKRGAYPSELSGGQQQRVGIARALALKPKVLLFDEPTSSLDPELVGEVLDVMRAIAAEKYSTMLVVTHEIQFAREVADSVTFMEGGVVVEQGTPAQVLANPQEARTLQFLKRSLL